VAGSRAVVDQDHEALQLHYSPYVRKVQAVLDLLDRDYTIVEVPYSDRNELATTPGLHLCPGLVDERRQGRARFAQYLRAPAGDQRAARMAGTGPARRAIGRYNDWCDGPLETWPFSHRLAAIRDHWRAPVTARSMSREGAA